MIPALRAAAFAVRRTIPCILTRSPPAAYRPAVSGSSVPNSTSQCVSFLSLPAHTRSSEAVLVFPGPVAIDTTSMARVCVQVEAADEAFVRAGELNPTLDLTAVAQVRSPPGGRCTHECRRLVDFCSAAIVGPRIRSGPLL